MGILVTGTTGRVVIFGDSIAEGLGTRGRPYAVVLEGLLGTTVVNRSVTGWTVADSLDLQRTEPEPCSVLVLAHGITEPILRPRPQSLRRFPKRWQRRGWMDPRPYYSSSRRRRIMERLESELRWRIKNATMRRSGTEQLMSQDDYVADVVEFEKIAAAEGARLVLLEPTSIDPRYFPGSDVQQTSYFEAATRAVPAAIVVPTRPLLDEWSDYLLDHFHPNTAGHRKIATAIARALTNSSSTGTSP